MKNIIKQPNRWSCMACVAAMIVGETLQDFIDFIDHDGSDYEATSLHPCRYRGFSWLEVMQYLLDRGYSLGAYLIANDGGLIPVGENTKCLNWDLPLSTPAIVGTKSKHTIGVKHVIYWTGEKVLDPDPDINDLELDDYEVEEWWPIVRHE